MIQRIPINGNKIPIVKGWQNTKKDYDLSSGEGIGLVCGTLSGGVEGIDVDCKYDLTGKLFTEYKKKIKEACEGLLEKLTVQKTTSGGYHLIYICSKIAGNKKLASRETTSDEKRQTYNAEIASGATKEEAQKRADADRFRVLIETRGEGGYLAIEPTKGYKVIYGSLDDIKTITEEERDALMSCAAQFNEVVNEYIPTERIEKIGKGNTPFDDYNQSGEVLGELEKHGWKIVGQKGSSYILLRPGQTTQSHSAYFNVEKNKLKVFSTSTIFDTDSSYMPYAVYTFLNHDKDFKKAWKDLYDKGYGDRLEKAIETVRGVPSKINIYDNNLSFVAKQPDYIKDVLDIRHGRITTGLKTHFPKLDEHWLLKPETFVVINGIDNVGKSTVIWYLALLGAMYHGWKWVIFTSENSLKGFYRKMYEFYWCKGIKEMSDEEFAEAAVFMDKYFHVIKSDDELYNYKDILNMTKKIITSLGRVDGLLIDPYNSLKIELTDSSKLSTHEYHYEAISDMKLFGKQEKMSIYLNCHAVTNATRQKDSDGHPSAPHKADTEGGAKFANKADDFITIHRKTQSPDQWMNTELHIRKIKEVETGGRVTPLNEPVIIEMVKGLVGFQQANAGQYVNPVLNWHLYKNETPPF